MKINSLALILISLITLSLKKESKKIPVEKYEFSEWVITPNLQIIEFNDPIIITSNVKSK